MKLLCRNCLGCLLLGSLTLGALPAVSADEAAQADGAEGSAGLDQVKHEWGEAVEVLGNYSAAQRDAAVASAERTLTAMDQRIERLEARTRQQWGKLTQSAREARELTLRKLRAQRNQVAEWYGGMKHSSAGAWESVKQGFIDSYAVLSESFSAAREEFGDDSEESP